MKIEKLMCVILAFNLLSSCRTTEKSQVRATDAEPEICKNTILADKVAPKDTLYAVVPSECLLLIVSKPIQEGLCKLNKQKNRYVDFNQSCSDKNGLVGQVKFDWTELTIDDKDIKFDETGRLLMTINLKNHFRWSPAKKNKIAQISDEIVATFTIENWLAKVDTEEPNTDPLDKRFGVPGDETLRKCINSFVTIEQKLFPTQARNALKNTEIRIKGDLLALLANPEPIYKQMPDKAEMIESGKLMGNGSMQSNIPAVVFSGGKSEKKVIPQGLVLTLTKDPNMVVDNSKAPEEPTCLSQNLETVDKELETDNPADTNDRLISPEKKENIAP